MPASFVRRQPVTYAEYFTSNDQQKPMNIFVHMTFYKENIFV